MRSPPLRGIAVPKSKYTARPQKEMAEPMIHSERDAPTEPTELNIEEGME
tara:strand:- start:452 stop:601 length:150 start_codon:yes stop_codon:yes gene_type:complete